MNDFYQTAEGHRLLQLLGRCWTLHCFGRVALVGESVGPVLQSLREKALLVETRTMAELTGETRGAFDAVVIIDPDFCRDSGPLAELALGGMRWLMVGSTRGTQGGGATVDRAVLLDWVRTGGWAEYPLGPLHARENVAFPLILCQPATGDRDGGSSPEVAQFWTWVAGFVRPNDQVGLVGPVPQASWRHLWMTTEAGRVGNLRDEDAKDPEWLAERSIGPGRRDLFDLIVIFNAAPSVSLAALARRLIPGGRFLIGYKDTPGALSVQLGPSMIPEMQVSCGVANPMRWESWMRTPLGGESVPYAETVFHTPTTPRPAIVDFAEHYENPWLMHAFVIGRFRLRSAAGLRELGERIVASFPPDSADFGGALCVLAYQALAEGRSLDGTLRRRLDAYATIPSPNPHVWRWQISLCFVTAKLDLMAGRYPEAEAGFVRCAGMDFLRFAPHLGTKCVEAAFLGGWLAWQRGDLGAAEQSWRGGLAAYERVGRVPLDQILIDPECPSAFEAGDGLREATIITDHAFRCANGLRAVNHRRTRGAARGDQIDRNLQETVQSLQQVLRQSDAVAAERLALVEQVRREWESDTERMSRVVAGYVFAGLAQQEQIEQLETALRERDYAGQFVGANGLASGELGSIRRLAILGAGRVAQFAAEALGRRHEIVAFIDANPSWSGKTLFGKPVQPLGTLGLPECDGVLVAESPGETGLHQLRQHLATDTRVLNMQDVFDRLVVFGAGAGGLQVLDRVPRKEMILCFADNDRRKQGTLLHGIRVVAPAELAAIDYRYIVIASMYRAEIEKQLAELGIPADKVLAVDPTRSPVVPEGRDPLRALTVARIFDGGIAAGPLERVLSFGKNCGTAALIDFAPATMAVGVMLAAGGCKVTAFGAPEFVRKRTAMGITATDVAPTPEEMSQYDVLVTGGSGWPDWLSRRFRPEQRLIEVRGRDVPTVHLRVGEVSFWYAPPRNWLVREPS